MKKFEGDLLLFSLHRRSQSDLQRRGDRRAVAVPLGGALWWGRGSPWTVISHPIRCKPHRAAPGKETERMEMKDGSQRN